MYISDLIFLHVLRGRMAEGPESHYELVPLDEAEIPPLSPFKRVCTG